METVRRDRVTSLQDLFKLVEQYREHYSDIAEDVYLDVVFELVMDTLTDGSKTFDIHISPA